MTLLELTLRSAVYRSILVTFKVTVIQKFKVGKFGLKVSLR